MAKKIITIGKKGLTEKIQGSGPVKDVKFLIDDLSVSKYTVGDEPEDKFKTIQEALDQLAEDYENDTSMDLAYSPIIIKPKQGNYKEDVVIRPTKFIDRAGNENGLRIIGATQNKNDHLFSDRIVDSNLESNFSPLAEINGEVKILIDEDVNLPNLYFENLKIQGKISGSNEFISGSDALCLETSTPINQTARVFFSACDLKGGLDSPSGTLVEGVPKSAINIKSSFDNSNSFGARLYAFNSTYFRSNFITTDNGPDTWTDIAPAIASNSSQGIVLNLYSSFVGSPESLRGGVVKSNGSVLIDSQKASIFGRIQVPSSFITIKNCDINIQNSSFDYRLISENVSDANSFVWDLGNLLAFGSNSIEDSRIKYSTSGASLVYHINIDGQDLNINNCHITNTSTSGNVFIGASGSSATLNSRSNVAVYGSGSVVADGATITLNNTDAGTITS